MNQEELRQSLGLIFLTRALLDLDDTMLACFVCWVGWVASVAHCAHLDCKGGLLSINRDNRVSITSVVASNPEICPNPP